MRSNISRKILSLLTLISLIIIQPVTAWASVVYAPEPADYISTSAPNTLIVQNRYMVANIYANDGTLFTQLSVSWELQPGDQLEIRWWDRQINFISTTTLDTSNISRRAVSVTPPSNAYAAKLVLRTGSGEGTRYAWWHSAANTNNITTIFPDPEISSDEGSIPSSGSNTTVVVDNSDVVSAINSVKSQLNNLTSDVNGHYSAVRNRLDTISSDIKNIYSYISTPRTPSNFDIEPLPRVSFDSGIPDISEPYQEPYRYDRADPVVPAPASQPEPLPYAPDPQVIPHDDPVPQQEPLQKDVPVARENPLSRTPVNMDDPLQMDPVSMDPPLQREYVAPDPPLQRDSPIAPDVPLSREPAIQRDPALQPDPPLTPQPPLLPQ